MFLHVEKKFEIFPSDVMAVIEFLSGKPDLAIYFNITPKNENFFFFLLINNGMIMPGLLGLRNCVLLIFPLQFSFY